MKFQYFYLSMKEVKIVITIQFPNFIVNFQMQEEVKEKKQKDFNLGTLTLSSNFQSGNIAQASMAQDNHINLWIQPDPSANYKTWFYFSLQGVQSGTTITFTIMNMTNQVKLFKEGHQPVYKVGDSEWKRIKMPLAANAVVKVETSYQVTFKHTFSEKNKHFFAFSYPWTTQQSNNLIDTLKSNLIQNVFCSYDQLCLSFKKRSVMLLTITKPKSSEEPELLSIGQKKDIITFKGKKGVFISARVHPGEVAASHMMNGILRSLFSDTKQSHLLLENFVFYIIPIINPDGVAEGNFRTDSQGKNLNRFYSNPTAQGEPEIYWIKKFLVQMINKKKIDFCLDLHAHVNRQGAFIYGNSVSADLKGQTEVCLFPKILSFHNQVFDYEGCNFSQQNMCSKDKSDNLSKQGASRVAIFKETGLTRCWTLQCNYNSAKVIYIPCKQMPENHNNSVSNVVITSKIGPDEKEQQKLLNIQEFQKIGIDVCQAIIDFYGLRKVSRIFGSKLRNMNNLKLNTSIAALRLMPFRFDAECRKLLNNINSGIQMKESLNKISKMIGLENILPARIPMNDFSCENRIKTEKNSRQKEESVKKQSIRRGSQKLVSKPKVSSSRNMGKNNSVEREVKRNMTLIPPMPSKNGKKPSIYIPLPK